MTVGDLANLACLLERFKSLKNLTLRMSKSNGFTDAGLARLAQVLKKHTSLESIDIILQGY